MRPLPDPSPEPHRFRAVLFDLGGVIVSSPFEGFARYERAAGLPEGFVRRVNSTDHDTNAWACWERGEIPRDEFVRRFEAEAASLGHRVDAEAVLASMRSEVRPSMVAALHRLRPHVRLGMITNNMTPMVRASSEATRTELHDVLDLFDVVVESSVVGLRKPDPAIFLLACERLAVEPRACVFLDDLGVNCKPARALGMATIKVVDPDDALAELAALVGFALG